MALTAHPPYQNIESTQTADNFSTLTSSGHCDAICNFVDCGREGEGDNVELTGLSVRTFVCGDLCAQACIGSFLCVLYVRWCVSVSKLVLAHSRVCADLTARVGM